METNHMNDSNSVSAGVDVDDDDDQGDFDVIVWHWLQKKNRLNAIATLVATASQTTVDDPRILPRVLRTLALDESVIEQYQQRLAVSPSSILSNNLPTTQVCVIPHRTTTTALHRQPTHVLPSSQHMNHMLNNLTTLIDDVMCDVQQNIEGLLHHPEFHVSNSNFNNMIFVPPPPMFDTHRPSTITIEEVFDDDDEGNVECNDESKKEIN